MPIPANQTAARVHYDILVIAAEEEEHLKGRISHILKIEHMSSTETLSCTCSNWLIENTMMGRNGGFLLGQQSLKGVALVQLRQHTGYL